MIELVSVEESEKPEKKWVATFKKDDKLVKTHFGQRGADDFTITGDKEQQSRYRARHKKDLKDDPTRAGYLSYFLLWNKPTLLGSIRDYKKRLAVFNETGEFPIE